MRRKFIHGIGEGDRSIASEVSCIMLDLLN